MPWPSTLIMTFCFRAATRQAITVWWEDGFPSMSQQGAEETLLVTKPRASLVLLLLLLLLSSHRTSGSQAQEQCSFLEAGRGAWGW